MREDAVLSPVVDTHDPVHTTVAERVISVKDLTRPFIFPSGSPVFSAS